jgi:hypothetical protein
MRWQTIPAALALIILLGGAFHVAAIQPLSEDELDQTNAAGVEFRIVGEEIETVEVDAADWFVNRIFGQNEVITRVVVEIVTTMDFTFTQDNDIDQNRDPENVKLVTDAEKDVSLVLDGSETDGAFKAVVNNIFGRNQVETSFNLTVFIPVSPGASAGGYSNPFAGGGGTPGPIGGSPTTPSVANAPTPLPQSPIAQFERPTTLSGAVSLMQNLAQQNPQAAPGLQTGISTVQSLPK